MPIVLYVELSTVPNVWQNGIEENATKMWLTFLKISSNSHGVKDANLWLKKVKLAIIWPVVAGINFAISVEINGPVGINVGQNPKDNPNNNQNPNHQILNANPLLRTLFFIASSYGL